MSLAEIEHQLLEQGVGYVDISYLSVMSGWSLHDLRKMMENLQLSHQAHRIRKYTWRIGRADVTKQLAALQRRYDAIDRKIRGHLDHDPVLQKLMIDLSEIHFRFDILCQEHHVHQELEASPFEF